MSLEHTIVKSLQLSAAKTYRLREALSKKVLKESAVDRLFDRAESFQQWIQCTAFLNHIQQQKYLEGNYYHRYVKETLDIAEKRKSELTNTLTDTSRVAVMNAVKEHVAANVSATFYEGYTQAFNRSDPAYWHKLTYRLVNREYIKQGCPEIYRELMDDFARIANNPAISDHQFNQYVRKVIDKLDTIKPNLKLTDWTELQEKWDQMSFLAHLSNAEFIEAHNVLMNDKKSFYDLKSSSLIADPDIRVYLEQYQRFLEEAEEAFVLAMNQRICLKTASKGNNYLLSPHAYLYDQLSSGRFEFDEVIFPMATYEGDQRDLTLYQVEDDKELDALYVKHCQKSSACCYCYVKSKKTLYKFSRIPTDHKLKIQLQEGVINQFLEPSSKEKQIPLQDFIVLQNGFVHEKAFTNKEFADRKAVLLSLAFPDALTDDQCGYFTHCVEQYIASQSEKLFNIQDVFQNNASLINRFKRYASVAKRKANELFDADTLLYSFDFVCQVLSDQDKSLRLHANKQFIAKFRLRKLVENNRLLKEIDGFGEQDEIQAWFKKHINAYLLIQSLKRLVCSAKVMPTSNLISQIEQKKEELNSTYIQHNSNKRVADYLIKQRETFDADYIGIREKQFREHIALLVQQLIALYYANAAIEDVLKILHSVVVKHEKFIATNAAIDQNTRPWELVLKETVNAYQNKCKADGGVIKDPTLLLFIYNKMLAFNAHQEEKIGRIKYHLEQNASRYLNDAGNLIINLIEANTSLDYRLQKTVLSNQSVIEKKSKKNMQYVVPNSLKRWLTGQDLDQRIAFMESKKTAFALMDNGFKAADALLSNSFIGFSTDNFEEALSVMRVAIDTLDKERNDVIEMSFFDQQFFHSKTWSIKNEWKNEATQSCVKLKSHYKLIIDKIKHAVLQDLKKGYFNEKLYRLYQEAITGGIVSHDLSVDENIRQVIFSFPFVLTKADDINTLLADKGYLESILKSVDSKLSPIEKNEYYNLLLDKAMQGLLEYASVIGDNTLQVSSELSLQKTQQQLKLQQIQNVVAALKEKMRTSEITLDFVHSPLLPLVDAFVQDEETRLTESSKNDVLSIISAILSLDGDRYKEKIVKINSIQEKRLKNDAIISEARRYVDYALHSPKGLVVSIAGYLRQLDSNQQVLFNGVYKQVMSPLLKYLLGYSYPLTLSNQLQHELRAPKEQLLAILENDLILDKTERLSIYSRLFAQISRKNELDFFDRRILAKIAQLKLSVKELSVTLDFMIEKIETTAERERALYLDIATHSEVDIKDSIMNCEQDTVLSAGRKSLFIYHFNRMKSNVFNDLYLKDSVPCSEMLRVLIDESYQEKFKEDYHYKLFLMNLKSPTSKNRELFVKQLDELHENGITLTDYLGSDNVSKLVTLLYDDCLTYEASLKQSLLLNDRLPQPVGVDKVILFNRFMPELSAVRIEKADCLFVDLLQKVQQDLIRFTKMMPLLKSLQSAFISPNSMIKAFANLNAYVVAMKSPEDASVTSSESDSMIQLIINQFKAIISPKTSDSPCELQQQIDYSLLECDSNRFNEMYFMHFQKPGLCLLEEKIDTLETSVGGAGFHLLFALQKNNTMQSVFKFDYNDCDKEVKRQYEAQYERVQGKIERFMSMQFDAIVSMDTIDSKLSGAITEWLEAQFQCLDMQLNSNANIESVDHYYRLINFYLRNKSAFNKCTIEEIETILQKNTAFVRNRLIPNLHPNSDMFLVNQSVEDKKGMSVKMTRERSYQTNALRAMIYQLMYPKARDVKDGLCMLKSAYLARGISSDNNPAHFDNMNVCRTKGYVFRYNAFEVFTKEPLNKLFFEDELSPLISFLGSYRTGKGAEQANKWKEKVSELYVNESLMSRCIASWYTYLFEVKLYSEKALCQNDVVLKYEEQMKVMLSLFHVSRASTERVMRDLFFDTHHELLEDDSGFCAEGDDDTDALLTSFKRLLSLTKIIFSLPSELSIHQQKQLYVIRLLKLSFEEADRNSYLQLALNELKAQTIVAPANTFFDWSILSTNERDFIKAICCSKLEAATLSLGQLSFASLIDLLQNKINYRASHKDISEKEEAILSIMSIFEKNIAGYFADNVSDTKEAVALTADFMNADVSPSAFASDNVRHKFMIANDMLAKIKYHVVHENFADMNCHNVVSIVIDVIDQAKKVMALLHLQSRQFVNLLDDCRSQLSTFILPPSSSLASSTQYYASSFQ